MYHKLQVTASNKNKQKPITIIICYFMEYTFFQIKEKCSCNCFFEVNSAVAFIIEEIEVKTNENR